MAIIKNKKNGKEEKVVHSLFPLELANDDRLYEIEKESQRSHITEKHEMNCAM